MDFAYPVYEPTILTQNAMDDACKKLRHILCDATESDINRYVKQLTFTRYEQQLHNKIGSFLA